jgi:uncharacterized membrane protein YkgB
MQRNLTGSRDTPKSCQCSPAILVNLHCISTIVAAVLIALRPLWPKVSAVGSAMAVVLFLGLVSFLFTTPGLTVGQLGGIPILGTQPGQFLRKTWCCWALRCGHWVSL